MIVKRHPQWIRPAGYSGAADDPDLKICFRKDVSIPRSPGSGPLNLTLSIWADSRYYLWIDGDFLGIGPSRCWPEHPQRDVYNIDIEDGRDEISIAVLVWHFGTSNSQYIHGPFCLGVSGSVRSESAELLSFGSDESWLSRRHLGYPENMPRINVSQPFVEMVNGSVFHSSWIGRFFDSHDYKNWHPVEIIDSPVHDPLDRFLPRDIPLLSSVRRIPEIFLAFRHLACEGIGVRIDYKTALYPGDTTTEDRYQLAYLATLIDSTCEQEVQVTLADRIWPEADERVILNGEVHTWKPGCRKLTLCLHAGMNPLLIDISGARQRFTTDIHFLPDHSFDFCSPLESLESRFIGLGPLASEVIGNIVCTDGFDLSGQNEVYNRIGEICTAEELSEYQDLAAAVPRVLLDGAKLRGIGAKVHNLEIPAETTAGRLIFPPDPNGCDSEYLLDMGSEVSGFVCFDIRAEEGAEIDFRFAEHIVGNELEIPDDLDNSLRYSCSSGQYCYRSLLRRGFRYMAIRVRSGGNLLLSNISVDERLFPLRHRGKFESDDTTLNEIWKMCRKTVELCSEDTIVDCPAFEQAYWIGDANVMALYHQYLFGDTRLVRHCLFLAAGSMETSELPDCHLPAGVSLTLSTWVQLWFLACRDYWIHSADEDFLHDIFPWLKKAISGFEAHIGPDGLLSIDAWNMLDWAGMDTPYSGSITHLNAGLVECYRAIARIAELLESPGDSRRWYQASDTLIESINRNLWDEKRGAYRDCLHADRTPSMVFSVQTNLMMLRYQCVPPHRLRAVRDIVVNPPAGVVLPGSPFMAHFYCDYLFSIGEGIRALDGIRGDWGVMLDHGTCWETFKGFYKDRLTRSYCHGWSSAPAYLFGAWILGVRPSAPGFREILISPVPAGLKSADGIVPTPAGDIHVRWWIRGTVFHCRVRLPEVIGWKWQDPEGDFTETDCRIETYSGGILV